jgi:hypothetical protein
MTDDSKTTLAETILKEIFRLDAQYQGGIIPAKNREDFIRTYLCPVIDQRLEAAPSAGYQECMREWQTIR